MTYACSTLSVHARFVTHVRVRGVLYGTRIKRGVRVSIVYAPTWARTEQEKNSIGVTNERVSSVSNSRYPSLLQSIQDPCKFHLILCFTLCHEKQSIHWILAKKFMNSFFQFKLRSSNALCCFLVVTIRFLSRHLQINHIICLGILELIILVAIIC